MPTSVTTTLITSQTALSIPISYDGSGAVGTRSLTVTSAQATGSCSSTIAVIGLADITTAISQPTPSLLPGHTSSLPISVSNIGSAATTGPITTTLTIPDNVATPASFTSNGFACSTVGASVTSDLRPAWFAYLRYDDHNDNGHRLEPDHDGRCDDYATQNACVWQCVDE